MTEDHLTGSLQIICKWWYRWAPDLSGLVSFLLCALTLLFFLAGKTVTSSLQVYTSYLYFPRGSECEKRRSPSAQDSNSLPIDCAGPHNQNFASSQAQLCRAAHSKTMRSVKCACSTPWVPGTSPQILSLLPYFSAQEQLISPVTSACRINLSLSKLGLLWSGP